MCGGISSTLYPSYRHYKSAERSKILSITHGWVEPSGPSHIHIETHTILSATLRGTSSTREEIAIIMSMDREIEDSGIIIKHLLCPIPMVYVLQYIN